MSVYLSKLVSFVTTLCDVTHRSEKSRAKWVSRAEKCAHTADSIAWSVEVSLLFQQLHHHTLIIIKTKYTKVEQQQLWTGCLVVGRTHTHTRVRAWVMHTWPPPTLRDDDDKKFRWQLKVQTKQRIRSSICSSVLVLSFSPFSLYFNLLRGVHGENLWPASQLNHDDDDDDDDDNGRHPPSAVAAMSLLSVTGMCKGNCCTVGNLLVSTWDCWLRVGHWGGGRREEGVSNETRRDWGG